MRVENMVNNKLMFYCNYFKDQILILDQDLPEVAVPKLYYKGEQVNHESQIRLDSLCLCKWYKDISCRDYS